jgi:hypothetical protein
MAEAKHKIVSKKQDQVTVPVRVQHGDDLYECDLDITFQGVPFKYGSFGLPEDKETEKLEFRKVDLTERNRRIEELLIKGKVTVTVKLGGSVDVVMETKLSQEVLDADIVPEGVKPPDGANNRWFVNYAAFRSLANVIVSYAGKEIGGEGNKDQRKKEEFVFGLPELVTEYLIGEYNRFLGELRGLLKAPILGNTIRFS